MVNRKKNLILLLTSASLMIAALACFPGRFSSSEISALVSAHSNGPAESCASAGPDELRVKACETLKGLLPQSSDLNPAWEQDWSTKCELKLEICDSVWKPPSHKIARTVRSGLDRFVRALYPDPLPPKGQARLNRLRVLLGLEPSIQPAPEDSNPKNLPLLEVVLFNKTAASAIRHKQASMLRALRNGQTPMLPPGSIIAKAVWGIYALSDTTGNFTSDASSYFYAATMTDLEENSVDGKHYAGLPPGYEDPDSHYWMKFPFESHPLDGICSDLKSPDCLHSAILDTKIHRDVHVEAQLSKISETNNTIHYDCGTGERCQVSLMGIHFMVRLRGDDPVRTKDINAIKSPWLFITMWWTGHDNHMGFPSPWNNYQIRVTQNLRDDTIAPGSTNRHIAYNPYLEGSRAGGAVSSCPTCHQFAAHNPNPKPNPDPSQKPVATAQCGSDSTLGFRLLPGQVSEFPVQERVCDKTRADYFKFTQGEMDDYVSTDFVWSLAGLSDKTIAQHR